MGTREDDFLRRSEGRVRRTVGPWVLTSLHSCFAKLVAKLVATPRIVNPT